MRPGIDRSKTDGAREGSKHPGSSREQKTGRKEEARDNTWKVSLSTQRKAIFGPLYHSPVTHDDAG